MIKNAKEAFFVRKINECHGDQKKLFQIVDKLLGRNKTTSLPYFTNPQIMSTLFNEFFVTKISNIGLYLPLGSPLRQRWPALL